MAVLSVSIPEELKKKMNDLEDVNWSAVARKALEEKIRWLTDIKEIERIARKSKLTEKDAKKIADTINRSVADKIMKDYETSYRREHSDIHTD